MSQDLETLITRWRTDMEDTVAPYLWSDVEITEYFDEAQDEFLEMVDLIKKEISISYTASDPWVDIPYYVTRVRDAETSDNRTVSLYNHEEFLEKIKTDDYGIFTLATNWKSTTGSYPEAMITDIEQDKARLYPIPTSDGTITATVYRRAVEPLEESGELEVTDREHQRCILMKARALGYMKHDSETFDAQKAADLDAQFEAKALKIDSRTNRRTRRARAVAYGGL